MAGSINKVIIIGHLGRDPEIRATQGGNKVANLSVATSESWRDKSSGERKEKTEWHRVTIWNENLVKVAEAYLSKGSQVYIEGKLQTRKWQDQSGNDRYSTEVVLQGFDGRLVLLDSKKDGGDEEHQQRYSTAAKESYGTGGTANNDLDDEIPF